MFYIMHTLLLKLSNIFIHTNRYYVWSPDKICSTVLEVQIYLLIVKWWII